MFHYCYLIFHLTLLFHYNKVICRALSFIHRENIYKTNRQKIFIINGLTRFFERFGREMGLLVNYVLKSKYE